MSTAGGARALLTGFLCIATAAVVLLVSPFVHSATAAIPVATTTAMAARQAKPVTPAVPAGSLSGRVVDVDNSTPLTRARLILTSASLPDPRVAISAADGTFTFERLPAGSYSLAVSRSGYAPGQYGQRRSAPATLIPVTDGQRVTGIDVALARAGVIHGQILDEDGQPFAGAVVDALVSRLDEGQATQVSLASARTDDRGEFRLTGLPAGQYYVSAIDPAFTDAGDETGPLRYTATYYPGVAIAERATRVSVVPGTEPPKISFNLQIIRPARVRGQLAAPDGRQLLSGAVVMNAIHGEGLASVPSHDVVLMPDGTFEFRNVPPGRYQIRARGVTQANGGTLVATYRVLVEGRDVGNAQMVLTPGGSAQGELLVDAIRSPRFTNFAALRVRAPFADGTSFGDSTTGDVGAQGAFALLALMPGNHVIRVEGLPYPWVLKSVTHRGQDVTDIGIEIDGRQDVKDLRVTITDVAAEVAGTVRDPRGKAVPDATIVFVPLSPQFWTRASRRFGLLRADASGRYRLRGLPPGEYRAIASTGLEEADVFRRDLLKDAASSGVPLSLKALEERSLDLPLWTMAARQ